MSIISQLDYVKDNKASLEKKYNGQYVVISENLEEKAFGTLDEAYQYGVKNWGLGNFLLQQFCANNNQVHIINQTITVV